MGQASAFLSRYGSPRVHDTRRGRAFLFGSIYFMQGITFASIVAFMGIFLSEEHDLGKGTIGVITMVTLLPLATKVLLGIVSDRYALFGMGHRKPYILIGLTLRMIAIGLFPFVSPVDHYYLFLFIALCAGFAIALYDTTTDGFTVDVTPPEERPYIQGIMVRSRGLGWVIGGLALALLVEKLSWTALFTGLSLLSVPFILLVLRIDHRSLVKHEDEEEPFHWSSFKVLLARDMAMLAAIGMLISAVAYGITTFFNIYLREEFSLESHLWEGTFTSIMGVGYAVGGAAVALISRRLGWRWSLIVCTTGLIAFIANMALITDHLVAFLLLFGFGLCFGMYEATYFALIMDRCTEGIGASVFATFMMVGQIGIAIGAVIIGSSIDNVGTRATFLLMALAVSLTYLLVELLRCWSPQAPVGDT